ncbi:MAG TPA: hypothetical protein VEO00_01110 [Actinomycetota bacterium]|nr:hypothetical protein [Actinomycetota bacterium]
MRTGTRIAVGAGAAGALYLIVRRAVRDARRPGRGYRGNAVRVGLAMAALYAAAWVWLHLAAVLLVVVSLAGLVLASRGRRRPAGRH